MKILFKSDSLIGILILLHIFHYCVASKLRVIQICIEAFFGQVDEVLDVAGGDIGPELDGEGAERGFDGGGFGGGGRGRDRDRGGGGRRDGGW